MYDFAKKARAGMKSKAERLAGEKDRKVDSSDWSPAEPLNADVKTGMRPVSRKAFKAGGKVSGCEAPMRADRKARKSGGRVEKNGEQPMVDRYVNRDLKKANEYRDGKKHVGGLKNGGRAKKAVGGEAPAEKTDMKFRSGKKPGVEFNKPYPVPTPPVRPTNLTPAANNKIKPDMSKYLPGDVITGPPKQVRKDGGRTKKADGGPMMQDPRLGIVKPKAMEFGQNVVTPGLKRGGRAEKADGGSMRERFNAEFAKQRAAGAKDFTFEGKKYTTDLYKPTTGPSTRGRGKTSAPDVKPSFGTPPMQASKFEGGKQDMMAYRSKGPSMGTTASKYNPITEKDDGRSIPTFVKKEFLGMDYKKNGGRIAKQIGGALGMSANRMMPQLPPQAMANAQGVPMQSGSFMPPGMANRPSMPPAMPNAAPAVMPSAASSPPMASPAVMPLARASGGRTKSKGKTNINIIIAAGGKKEPESMVPTVPPAPMGAQPVPVPAAPPAAPMGMPPMPTAPMMGGAPSGPPAGPHMPPMPRKSGGRVSKVAHSYKDMTAGAGSGEGRLQKTDIAKRSAHKSGGKVYRSYKDMDAGAGSGEGRLEKTEIQKRKH